MLPPRFHQEGDNDESDNDYTVETDDSDPDDNPEDPEYIYSNESITISKRSSLRLTENATLANEFPDKTSINDLTHDYDSDTSSIITIQDNDFDNSRIVSNSIPELTAGTEPVVNTDDSHTVETTNPNTALSVQVSAHFPESYTSNLSPQTNKESINSYPGTTSNLSKFQASTTSSLHNSNVYWFLKR